MNIRTDGARNGTAVDDDTYDGAEDSRSPMGWGRTEKQAIDDLKEQIHDAYCFR